MKQILYSPLPSVQSLLEPSLNIKDSIICSFHKDFQEAIVNIGVIIAQNGCPTDFNERIMQVLGCCAEMYTLLENIIREQEEYYSKNA